jgi:hypothetical protein
VCSVAAVSLFFQSVPPPAVITDTAKREAVERLAVEFDGVGKFDGAHGGLLMWKSPLNVGRKVSEKERKRLASVVRVATASAVVAAIGAEPVPCR